MREIGVHIFWNVLAIIGAIILAYYGNWLVFKSGFKSNFIKKWGIFNIIVGISIIVVDIFFMYSFLTEKLLPVGLHILWELMSVVVGIIFIWIGVKVFKKYKNKKVRFVGILNIGLGIIYIIIDGFYFFPSQLS